MLRIRHQRDRALRAPLTRLLAGAGALVLAGTVLGSPASAVRPELERPVAGTRCSEFPADNWWHADVSGLPVHARSAAWLSHMSTDVDLHPDFGPSYGDGPNYGIPITVVGKKHKLKRVSFDYSSESDHVRYPVGRDTKIEGGRGSDGDRHAIIVDKSTCRLYELYATSTNGRRWHAGSGAVWSLKKNKLRPDGWTSADAAGLPILPGLLRWNEVKKNQIDHAIRFTVPTTSQAHLWPARHDAGSTSNPDYPPMGARFRLAASYDASSLSPYAQHVVAAMKTYGLVLADNGSAWYFQGEQNRRWPDGLIEDLKTIPASAFVAVDTSGLQVSPNSAQVR
ncbi:MAG TPA: hypothetical protein PLZ93_00555 [Nocardioides sp.]|uniref:hypothetical protein n=1 Tax=uncultured Nocardioides sp. TaxID=198441 RepID=UPI0026063D28|nr:hypothetical protein [uncultured Nocardioides sp.]HRI94082.1 hypothetical protein [Nocardioides sp.]HRK44111.1 hypothetical protein [Nocardioides sp.]